MIDVSRRPWLLAISLAPLPAVITQLSMLRRLSWPAFSQLLAGTHPALAGDSSPWFPVARGFLWAGVLVGALAWLSAAAPAVVWRRGRSGRAVVGLLALLTAGAFWMGVILGDVARHAAFRDLPGVGKPGSLAAPTRVHLLSVLAAGLVIYLLVRPKPRWRLPTGERATATSPFPFMPPRAFPV